MSACVRACVQVVQEHEHHFAAEQRRFVPRENTDQGDGGGDGDGDGADKDKTLLFFSLGGRLQVQDGGLLQPLSL